ALIQHSTAADTIAKFDEKYAINHIDAAMAAAKAARVDDGAPLTEHPPIEAKMVYRDRLRQAQRALEEAARDLAQPEDNTWARKDRDKAIDNVKSALKGVTDAIGENHASAEPPAPAPTPAPAPPPAN